jgi:hypothetical protein
LKRAAATPHLYFEVIALLVSEVSVKTDQLFTSRRRWLGLSPTDPRILEKV